MGGISSVWLTRLRPRDSTLFVSQGRSVLATSASGEIAGEADHGFFVYQTRLLSRYRYLVDGKPWLEVGVSNVQQHSSLGYYIAWPPGLKPDPGKEATPSRQAVELVISRTVGGGMHEDVDITNYSQTRTEFTLGLEVAGDFADQNETGCKRQHRGRTTVQWAQDADGTWSLYLEHRAEHRHRPEGDAWRDGLVARVIRWGRHGSRPASPRAKVADGRHEWQSSSEHGGEGGGGGDGAEANGIRRIHRGLRIRIGSSGSTPEYRNGRISFRIVLEPLQTWHACLDLVAFIDGMWLPPTYGCYAFGPTQAEEDIRRRVFIRESTGFETPGGDTLGHVVRRVLEQAKYDLASLRLFDLDKGERAWTMAAGLPVYVALFGRDTLTAAWQAGILGPEMLRGTLPVIADLQGRHVDDWRDEQPGKLLHEAQTGPLSALDYLPRGRYYGAHTTSAFYPVAVTELWHWTGDASASSR